MVQSRRVIKDAFHGASARKIQEQEDSGRGSFCSWRVISDEFPWIKRADHSGTGKKDEPRGISVQEQEIRDESYATSDFQSNGSVCQHRVKQICTRLPPHVPRFAVEIVARSVTDKSGSMVISKVA